MPNELPPISVEPTPLFKRELRTLAKSYRKVRSDIEPLIAQLQAGELPGDRVPGIKYTVFKVRLKNSSVQKGKSGGYRIIYYPSLITLRREKAKCEMRMFKIERWYFSEKQNPL